MKVTREDLIKMIKENDSFYAHVTFAGFEYEQLLKIYKEIEKSKKFIQKTIKDE